MKRIITAAVSAALAAAMLGTTMFCGVYAEGLSEYNRLEMNAYTLKSAEEDMLPYQYDELSSQAQKCYLDIRKAIIAHKNSTKISSRISEKTLIGIAALLREQDPFTFGGVNIEFNGVSTDNAYARLTYSYAKDVDESAAKQTAKEADMVIAAFPQNAYDYTKFLAIHDHIAAVSEKDDSGAYSFSRTAYGALVNGKASSVGYAYAFQYISIKAGLVSIVVSGTDAEGKAHCWNKVKIGANWYNVDCFKDDETGNRELFMVSDETIKQFYTENSSAEYPAANDDSLSVQNKTP